MPFQKKTICNSIMLVSLRTQRVYFTRVVHAGVIRAKRGNHIQLSLRTKCGNLIGKKTVFCSPLASSHIINCQADYWASPPVPRPHSPNPDLTPLFIYWLTPPDYRFYGAFLFARSSRACLFLLGCVFCLENRTHWECFALFPRYSHDLVHCPVMAALKFRL